MKKSITSIIKYSGRDYHATFTAKDTDSISEFLGLEDDTGKGVYTFMAYNNKLLMPNKIYNLYVEGWEDNEVQDVELEANLAKGRDGKIIVIYKLWNNTLYGNVADTRAMSDIIQRFVTKAYADLSNG